MQVLKLTGNIEMDGHIRLDIPTSITPHQPVEMLLVIEAGDIKKKNNFDFSDLTGKLEWAGDPVTEQRNLRHEW